jgi:hypothetical protein
MKADKQSTTFALTFPAEVKQVSSKKLASNDVEFRLILDTADPAVLNLGTLDGDQLVDVTVELQS